MQIQTADPYNEILTLLFNGTPICILMLYSYMYNGIQCIPSFNYYYIIFPLVHSSLLRVPLFAFSSNILPRFSLPWCTCLSLSLFLFTITYRLILSPSLCHLNTRSIISLPLFNYLMFNVAFILLFWNLLLHIHIFLMLRILNHRIFSHLPTKTPFLSV